MMGKREETGAAADPAACGRGLRNDLSEAPGGRVHSTGTNELTSSLYEKNISFGLESKSILIKV